MHCAKFSVLGIPNRLKERKNRRVRCSSGFFISCRPLTSPVIICAICWRHRPGILLLTNSRLSKGGCYSSGTPQTPFCSWVSSVHCQGCLVSVYNIGHADILAGSLSRSCEETGVLVLLLRKWPIAQLNMVNGFVHNESWHFLSTYYVPGLSYIRSFNLYSNSQT